VYSINTNALSIKSKFVGAAKPWRNQNLRKNEIIFATNEIYATFETNPYFI